MTKDEWARKIRSACKKAGTYQPQFKYVIETLAQIMETKDAAIELYTKSGGNPVVAYTNKGGHTNLRKNPALAVIQECNVQALAYWRDLGLTPAGLKKLNADVVKDTKTEGGLEKLLAGLGDV